MNKLKKIAKVILISLLILFGIYSVSNAYYIGQSLTVTYSEYASSSKIFCVEHGQALTADNYYTVISNVKIEGTKSTDQTGKIIDNLNNAKFAYILSSNNSNNVQNEIWNFGYTWMNSVGKYHQGLYSGFMSSVRGISTELGQKATQYANNITNDKTVTDETKKDDIKVVAHNKDGKEYVKVGPFKWKFGGTLEEISVYDQNSNPISEPLYSVYNGNDEKWVNVSDINSNNEFYISIPADQGVSKITKIKGK